MVCHEFFASPYPGPCCTAGGGRYPLPAHPALASDTGEEQRAPERVLEIKINLDALFGSPAKAKPKPKAEAKAAQPPAAPEAVPPRTRIVAPGESLSLIAGMYDMDLGTVFALNGMGWETIIHPGQAIILEAQAAPAPAPATPAPAAAAQVPAGSVPELVAASARSKGVGEALPWRSPNGNPVSPAAPSPPPEPSAPCR